MLKTKMLRDIRKNLSQYITIFLMILIGIFAYTGIEAYMLGMQKSADNYYEKNNLEDFTVYGKFSNNEIKTAKKIYNVNEVNGKLTLPALGVIEGKEHHLNINFIEENTVSIFHIVDGIKFDKDNEGIWLDNSYAENNKIKVGDTLTINYENSIFTREVVGLITVPDLVYYTKDETELFTDHKDFGFIYMSSNKIPRELIDNDIANKTIFTKEYFEKGPVIYQDYINYNNLLVDVNRNKNIPLAKEQIKDKFNIDAIIDIEDSMSYKTYQEEIDQGKAYVGVFSGLFIFIAILSVITSMSRLVKKERKEIGTLKALGYSNKSIFIHYLSYGFYISLVAALLGIVLGYFILGNFFIKMEMEYYVLPSYRAYIDSSTYLVSILVIVGVLLATYLSTRKILNKNAADTLRFEKPTVNKREINFTKNRLFKHMSFSTKWNIRDILRNKIRTFMGLIGIVGCMILLVVALGMKDTINNYLKIEFNVINDYKNKINISKNIDMDNYKKLIETYSNNTSLNLMIEIKDGDNLLSNNIFVNDSNGHVKTIDENKKEMVLENDGVYITRNLSKKLNKKVNDTITWRIYGTDKYYKSKIIGLNMDPQNQNITMSKEYYESLELPYIADTIYTDNDVENIDIEGVSNIQSIDNLTSGVHSMIDTLISMVYLIIFVACLLGIVIIYNLGILSFTEKNYQFATLKVLGFSNFKISRIFIKQNIWISIISIMLGLFLGNYTLTYIFNNALSIDYDFSAYISNETYIITSIITFVLTLIVSILLSRKIRKIDMVTSLKGNE